MHVLVIPRGLYDIPSLPGQGIFEMHQVDALKSAGIEIGVVSSGFLSMRTLGRRIHYERIQTRDGQRVFRSYRRGYRPGRLRPPEAAARSLYRTFRSLIVDYLKAFGRPDVVHAHNQLEGGLLASLLYEDFGIPYVITEHSSRYASHPSQVVRDLQALERVAANAAAILPVGRRLAFNLSEAYSKHLRHKIRVVPNVLDASLLSQGTQVSEPRHPPVVVGLGHLIPRKNYALLVEAFSALPTDARLVIGGSGRELDRLRVLSQRLGVSSRVDLPGRLGRAEISSLLRGASIFAHPSNNESFGVVVIEALACGVPVVATASGGPEDLVKSEDGLITPVGDVKAFTDALAQVYSQRYDYDRNRIAEDCRHRFGPEAFTQQMQEVYRDAMTNSD